MAYSMLHCYLLSVDKRWNISLSEQTKQRGKNEGWIQFEYAQTF